MGILLLHIQNCQLLCLFCVVDDSLFHIIANQIIFCIRQNTIQTGYLTLKEFDDIVGLSITQLSILAGKYLIQNIQGVIGYTCIISRIANVYDITSFQLENF